MGQQDPQFLAAQRLHMDGTIKPYPHHLRYAARIVAVRLAPPLLATPAPDHAI
jgi:hypothetical protein